MILFIALPEAEDKVDRGDPEARHLSMIRKKSSIMAAHLPFESVSLLQGQIRQDLLSKVNIKLIPIGLNWSC